MPVVTSCSEQEARISTTPSLPRWQRRINAGRDFQIDGTSFVVAGEGDINISAGRNIGLTNMTGGQSAHVGQLW